MGDRAAEVAVVADGAQAFDGVDGDRAAEVAAEVAVVADGAQAFDGVDGHRAAEVAAEVAVVAHGAEWSDASDREWGGWDVKHGPSDFARGVTHCVGCDEFLDPGARRYYCRHCLGVVHTHLECEGVLTDAAARMHMCDSCASQHDYRFPNGTSHVCTYRFSFISQLGVPAHGIPRQPHKSPPSPEAPESPEPPEPPVIDGRPAANPLTDCAGCGEFLTLSARQHKCTYCKGVCHSYILCDSVQLTTDEKHYCVHCGPQGEGGGEYC